MAARRVKGPPHCGQAAMSIANTRLSNCAQLMRVRVEAEGGSPSASEGAVAWSGPSGTIWDRSAAWGASTPWKRMRWSGLKGGRNLLMTVGKQCASLPLLISPTSSRRSSGIQRSGLAGSLLVGLVFTPLNTEGAGLGKNPLLHPQLPKSFGTSWVNDESPRRILTGAWERANEKLLVGLLEGLGASHPKRKILSPFPGKRKGPVFLGLFVLSICMIKGGARGIICKWLSYTLQILIFCSRMVIRDKEF